ncbi:MAG: hypothetical protein ACMUIE_09840 [Thermoplasmatota archaeon]
MEERQMRKNGYFIVLPLAAILVFVVAAGCLEEEGENEEAVVLQGKGELSATDETLILEIISGSYEWTDYKVTVDGTELRTDETSSSAGETAEFYDPDEELELLNGEEYTVKIVDIESNRLIWEMDIIAEGGEKVPTMSLNARIYNSTDTIVFEVLQGTINWWDYQIIVDGTDDFATDEESTSAGETATFYHSEDDWHPAVGESYNVKIIDIAENKVVWEKDTIAIVS